MALPSQPFLTASLKKWKRAHTHRQKRLEHWRGEYQRARNSRERDRASARIAKWERKRDQASAYLRRRRGQLKRYGPAKPRIVTAKQAGLSFVNRWGGKGNIYRGAWHYTAGPRAKGATDLLRLGRQYHAYHQSMGWPGLSYEALIADDGTILFANPISIKSAGVASNNSGLVNICCPGTTGDRLTAGQKSSVKWLRSRWHTRDVPSTHRLPRPAADLAWRPHNEFPSQSTACPGAMAHDYKEAWR